MSIETPTTAAIVMDRGIPLGNSLDSDGRRALHTKVKNLITEPIPIVSIPLALVPVIVNQTSPLLANTEFAVALPVGTQQFRLKSRKITRIKIAYVLGETVTNYYTLPLGADFYENFIGSVGIIYLSCDKPSQDIELIAYKT